LLVGVIYLAVSTILVAALGTPDIPGLVNGIFALTLLLTPLAYLLFVTIWFAYRLVLDSLGRRTLGELTMGLKMVSRQGDRLTFPRILVKDLLIYVDSVALGLVGLFVILLTKRTIGEIASGVQHIREG
jgi:uncharacterized RDD family membrane protein YckC